MTFNFCHKKTFREVCHGRFFHFLQCSQQIIFFIFLLCSPKVTFSLFGGHSKTKRFFKSFCQPRIAVIVTVSCVNSPVLMLTIWNKSNVEVKSSVKPFPISGVYAVFSIIPHIIATEPLNAIMLLSSIPKVIMLPSA